MSGETLSAVDLTLDDEVRISAHVDPAVSFDTILHIELRRGEKRFLGEVVFHEHQRGVCPPRLAMSDRSAQRLADSLWDAGARPRGAAGSAGQLDATRAHLDDMRQIARGFLDGKTAVQGDARDLRRVAAMASALGRLSASDLAGAAQVLEEALRP